MVSGAVGRHCVMGREGMDGRRLKRDATRRQEDDENEEESGHKDEKEEEEAHACKRCSLVEISVVNVIVSHRLGDLDDELRECGRFDPLEYFPFFVLEV
jgi:hypothetical protein